MASITSVVTFFILLLATFSYSAPIGEEYGNSTSEYEYTTNQNMADWTKPGNMRSMVDDESTSVPVIRDEHLSENNDLTTEYVTRSSRDYEDSSYSPATDSTVEPNYAEYTSPSSVQMNEQRINEYSTVSPSSESSEERNRETYSSPASIRMNLKRNYEDSTYPSTSEISEEQNRETYSSPASIEMNPKRNYEDSTYPSTSESSEEGNRETYSSPSSLRMNENRNDEYSTYVPTSESSEGSSETYSTPSSTQMHEKRNAMLRQNAAMNAKRADEDFLYTTMESSTQFNQRAIQPVEFVQQAKLPSIIYPSHVMEMTSDTQPLTSPRAFVRYTGLLVGQGSTTPEYETTDRPDEESTTDASVQSEQLTKTVSVIPGRNAETKIYTNAPGRTSVVIQPAEQHLLSQVQTQQVAQTKESDN